MDEDELIRSILKEIRDEQKVIQARLASLEQFRWMFAGGMLVITALIIPIFMRIVI